MFGSQPFNILPVAPSGLAAEAEHIFGATGKPFLPRRLMQSNNHLSMTAKLDPQHEILYAKPPPHPLDLRGSLAQALKGLDSALRKEQNLEIVLELRACLFHVEHAARLCGKTLPGLEDVENKAPKPKFKRPTLEEVKSFCLREKITVRDAEWFWLKMEGSGWKNGGKPVVSWERTLLAWERGNYLPSQRVGYTSQVLPRTKTILEQDIERLGRAADRL